MKLAGPADNFKHHRLERLIIGGNIYSDTMHHLRQAIWQESTLSCIRQDLLVML
jgi:hypothetical protein